MSWEDTFQSWAKPPGQTEQDKCDNAVRAVQKAIEASKALRDHNVKALPQGSYHNRTNVRMDSDVDIRVVTTDSIFFDLPDGKTAADFGINTPATYSFPEFKSDVAAALESHFGKNAVVPGRKAFDIHENTYRIDADAVPCFEYRRYREDGSYLKGASFIPDQGGRIINWPDQNYEHGVAKNDETGRRFKGVVRILKRLRNEMEEKNIAAAKPISSFLIECLVWNAPNEGFGHDTLNADIRWALAHLFNNTMKEESCKEWGEINELKYLFRSSQRWNRGQAHSFVSAAWDYIGLK